jgi:hypothetical protein
MAEEYGLQSKRITELAAGLQGRGHRSEGVTLNMPLTVEADGGAATRQAMQRDEGAMDAPLTYMGASEVPAETGPAEIAANEPVALENKEMEDIENELNARVRDELAQERAFLAKTAAADAEGRRSGAQNSSAHHELLSSLGQ